MLVMVGDKADIGKPPLLLPAADDAAEKHK